MKFCDLPDWMQHSIVKQLEQMRRNLDHYQRQEREARAKAQKELKGIQEHRRKFDL